MLLPKMIKAIKIEVMKLLERRIIQKEQHLNWIVNVILVIMKTYKV